MARITRTLITKSGWRPCPTCHAPREDGQACLRCSDDARRLIHSVMTPALRRLANEIARRFDDAAHADPIHRRDHARA